MEYLLLAIDAVLFQDMEAIYDEEKINYIGKILDEIFQGNKSTRILDVGAGTGGSGQLVSRQLT